jgi:hypothetical protein
MEDYPEFWDARVLHLPSGACGATFHTPRGGKAAMFNDGVEHPDDPLGVARPDVSDQ